MARKQPQTQTKPPAPTRAETRLPIRLTPRSSGDRLVGLEDGRLKISLSAPPVDGKANRSLLKFLGKLLGVGATTLSVSQGEASRMKTVVVSGLEEAEVWSRLEKHLGGGV
ncbi:MAG: DUF167 family protein [Deltaproteobacteria bacterium]|jgi:uncharacterized protein (TIGR00251 family)|nr:DUF167 family protein [Deltaproteobacteria bacterium]